MAFDPLARGLCASALTKPRFTAAGALTAAGTTQGTALALTADINEVTSCAAGAGVKLPAAVAGAFCTVSLATGQGFCRVYPASGNNIEALAANVAFPIVPGTNVEFYCATAGTWRARYPQRLLLATSTTQVSHTGDTAEFVLVSPTVPANIMGPNGILILTFVPSSVGSGNHTWNVRFSGTAGTIYIWNQQTTNTSGRVQAQIHNAGATNSQKGAQKNLTGSWGYGAGYLITSAVDTTADTTVVISGQLGTSTDTISVEHYSLEVIRN